MCPFLSRTVESAILPPDPLPEGDLVLVGWREWLQLPEFGSGKIKTKIDSGARTSSLHVADYEIFENEQGRRVRIDLEGVYQQTIERPLHDRRIVRDSGGHEEERPYILTSAFLGGREWEIEISLTSRAGMLFPMLLGRKALAGRFVISPSDSYLLGRKTKKGRKKT